MSRTIVVRGDAESSLEFVSEQACDPEAFGLDADERAEVALLAAHYDRGRMTIPADPVDRETMARALDDLANSEDHMAEHFEDPMMRRMARHAREGLTTLARRVRR